MRPTITLPRELAERLDREARSRGVTVAMLLEQLLEQRDRAEMSRRMREERAQLTPEQRAEIEAEYIAWADAGGARTTREEPGDGGD